jgi:hypothetical protein
MAAMHGWGVVLRVGMRMLGVDLRGAMRGLMVELRGWKVVQREAQWFAMRVWQGAL